MNNVKFFLPFLFKKEKIITQKDILKDELTKTKEDLEAAYSVLQYVTEPELIDCAIYEVNSIQSRYSFLRRKYQHYNK